LIQFILSSKKGAVSTLFTKQEAVERFLWCAGYAGKCSIIIRVRIGPRKEEYAMA